MRNALLCLGLLPIAGCGSPELAELPPSKPALPAKLDYDPTLPAEQIPVQPLEENGVPGGEMTYTLPGTPEQVAEMLRDFHGDMDEYRAWAKTYDAAGTRGGTVLAIWHFEGRMGFNPTVTVGFDREDLPDGAIRISFHIVDGSTLLKVFTGDHLLRPWPAEQPTTLVTSRTFIGSGLPFVGASKEDVATGLRSDAESMRLWMHKRLQR